MTQSGNRSQSGRSRVVRRVGVVAFCIALIFYVAFRFAGNARSKLLAEIREFGAPTSFEELGMWYETPEDEKNAGLVISQSFPVVDRTASGEVLPAGAHALESMDGATSATVEALVALNQRFFESMKRARGLPASRYPIDLSMGFQNLTVNHLSQLSTGGKLLAADARRLLQRGDVESAALRVEELAALTNTLKDEPLLISCLVLINLRGIQDDVTGRLLSEEGLTPGILDRLERTNDIESLKDVFWRSWMGECVGYISQRVDPATRGSLFSEVMMQLTDGSALRQIGWLFGFAKTLREVGVDSEVYYRLQSTLTAQPGGALKEHRTFDFQTIQGRIYTRLGDIIARASAIQVAIDMERRRLSEGEIVQPETLPIDPFSGQPMRFRSNEATYIIYSVGENETDEGGAPLNVSEAGDTGVEVSIK